MAGGERWHLTDPIGAGSVGEVWRATDALTGQPVALKRLKPDAPDYHLDSLRREVDALRHIPAHPALPALVGHDLRADPPYLVMSLAQGEPLNVLLASGEVWRFSLAQRLDALHTLADAVAHLHAHGWLHRDLKPANLRGLSPLTVLDFGLACRLDAPAPKGGTPAYQPPEPDTSPASDGFAVAVTAYELLLGAHPLLSYDDHGQPPDALRALMADRMQAGQWRAPSGLAPAAMPADLRGADLSALTDLFLRGLSPDPIQRPTDLRAWVEGVAQAAAPDGLYPAPSPFSPEPQPPNFTEQQAAGHIATRHPPPQGWRRFLRWAKRV